MANEKKYSEREAAQAVLSKAQEIMNKSELFKSAKMKKDATSAIQGGINAATGGQAQSAPPPSAGVASALSGAFGKNEKNPDEKQDAKLGENVEHLCEEHMLANKDAERKEGHKIVQKSECAKCMSKAEFSELYEDLAKMEQTENKEEPSKAKEDPSKPIERDHDDFEAKPGHADAPDHREAPQTPPAANPKEQHEGNNPPAGTIPGNGIHKLMYYMGHVHSKKKMKKGIALS